MEPLLNSSVEKQSIYEIFRACRLCGGGAGYKMPIIQNVVDLESSEVELKQKIKECVQIEVHQEDKMPPLICELCVDKVNDFYEFLDMCRQINKRTRLRLGLPPQAMPQGAASDDDCILGVTEPVYINEDSNEPLYKQKIKSRPNNKAKKEESVKSKNEPELRVKIEKKILKGIPTIEESTGRFVRSSKRLRSPIPSDTNQSGKKPTNNDDISLARLKSQKKIPRVIITKGILKKENKIDDSLLVPRLKKRLRERTPHKSTVPTKKVKLSIKPEPTKAILKQSPRFNNKTPLKPILRSKSDSKISSNSRLSSDSKTSSTSSSSRTSSDSKTTVDSKVSLRSITKPVPKIEPKPTPKSVSKPTPKSVPKPTPKSVPKPTPESVPKPVSKRPPSPPPVSKCTVCKQQFKVPTSLSNHMRVHTASFTSERAACNACQDWFRSPEEAAAHHKSHARGKKYHCTRCFSDFKLYQGYLDHIKETCIPLYEVPDVQCHVCWKYFPTDNLRDQHNCPGEDGRPGGKCEHCKRNYATLKSLNKHKDVCSLKKKEFVLDPVLKSKLRPVRVRTARCDPLLTNPKNGRFNVTDIDKDFGLDKTCIYPFRNNRHKPKFEGMVKFNDDFDFENMFVHWDSDDSEESSDTNLSDSILNPFIRKKYIDKLSTLSLKTIFSHRFLGKVPRKRKKLKFSDTNCYTHKEIVDKIIDDIDSNEDNEEQSELNIVNDSVKNKPEDIKESYDNIERHSDTIEDNSKNVGTVKEDNIDGISKTHGNSVKETCCEINLNTSADEDIKKTNENINSNGKIPVKEQENDTTNPPNNETTMENDHITESNKMTEINQISTADEVTSTIDLESKELIDTYQNFTENKGETNSNTSNTKQKEESVDKNNPRMGENTIINSSEEIKSTDFSDPCQKTVQNRSLNDDKDNVFIGRTISKINESNKQLDTSDKKELSYTEPTHNNGEIKTPAEQRRNSINLSSEINVNQNKTNNENKSTASCVNKFKEEFKEKQTLESEANKSDVDISKDSVLSKDNEKISSDVSKSMNGEPNNASTVDVNDECDIEMDDKQLMDELDAQIGENDNNKNVECEKSQTESNVLPKKDQSMDLESISDEELNF